MVSRGKRSISLITYISEKKNEMHNKRKDAQNECAKQYTTFKIFKKEIRDRPQKRFFPYISRTVTNF